VLHHAALQIPAKRESGSDTGVARAKECTSG